MSLDKSKREAGAAKEELHLLQQEYDSTRKDCEHMVKVIQNLEKQVAEAKAKESKWLDLEKESVEKVSGSTGSA